MDNKKYVAASKKMSQREALFWKLMLLLFIALLAFLFSNAQSWLFPDHIN